MFIQISLKGELFMQTPLTLKWNLLCLQLDVNVWISRGEVFLPSQVRGHCSASPVEGCLALASVSCFHTTASWKDWHSGCSTREHLGRLKERSLQSHEWANCLYPTPYDQAFRSALLLPRSKHDLQQVRNVPSYVSSTGRATFCLLILQTCL